MSNQSGLDAADEWPCTLDRLMGLSDRSVGHVDELVGHAPAVEPIAELLDVVLDLGRQFPGGNQVNRFIFGLSGKDGPNEVAFLASKTRILPNFNHLNAPTPAFWTEFLLHARILACAVMLSVA